MSVRPHAAQDRYVRAFCSGLVEAVGLREKARRDAKMLVYSLERFDPSHRTKFEFSVQVRGGRLLPVFRFLNLDVNLYSSRNQRLFLCRLALFQRLMARLGSHPGSLRVIHALEKVAETPMDLYFGADIDAQKTVYGFWLIFGGVRFGQVNFCSYDYGKVITRTLKTIGLKKPPELRKDILNLGFDIGADGLSYKVYYLCREKVLAGRQFTPLMRTLNQELKAFHFFYFYSEMYDAGGHKIKEKLFMEFLEDISGVGRGRRLLIMLQMMGWIGPDAAASVGSLLRSNGGRISLVSFEADRTLTIYIRESSGL